MEEIFTNNIQGDTLDIENILVEEEEMLRPTKFYNFNCINLYAYIDTNVAMQLTQLAQLNTKINNLINLPLELYENPYTAKLFSSTSTPKALVSFAICVENNIFDTLDLELEDKIKNSKISFDDNKKKAGVVRELKKYLKNGTGKARFYIAYKVQNTNAIKQVCPLYN